MLLSLALMLITLALSQAFIATFDRTGMKFALDARKVVKDRARNHINKRIKPGVFTTSHAYKKFRGFPRKKPLFIYELTRDLAILNSNATLAKSLYTPINVTIPSVFSMIIQEFDCKESISPGLGRYHMQGILSSDFISSILDDLDKELKEATSKNTFSGGFSKGEYSPGQYFAWKKKAVIKFICNAVTAVLSENGLLVS
jgi:hypothetical protein